MVRRRRWNSAACKANHKQPPFPRDEPASNIEVLATNGVVDDIDTASTGLLHHPFIQVFVLVIDGHISPQVATHLHLVVPTCCC